MERDRRLVLIGTAVAATLGAAFLLRSSREKEKVKKLHVEYEHPEFPTFVKIVASLPDPVRRYLSAKLARPRPPTDGCDILGVGAHDPYTRTELVDGRLWRVRYEFLIQYAEFKKAMKGMFGVDYDDPSILDRMPDDAARRHMENDLKIMSELGGPERTDLELLEDDMVSSQDMLVARLDGGGLLLYNPCRMHPSMVKWLRALAGGDEYGVEWIVSGSSAHTNQLPQAAAAFPSAKILCAEAADIKCRSVGMRPAHYIYTDRNEKSRKGLEAARKLLRPRGVKLWHIQGDVFTQSLALVTHGHLFEIDLLYGHHTGKHWAQMFDASMDSDESVRPMIRFGRIIYHGAIAAGASATGYVPNYRHMAMDPSSQFSALFLDRPKADGSSCTDMAASLRELLKLDFEYVDSAHSMLEGSMDAHNFRKSIDSCWSWLDGRSLCSP